MNRRDWQKDWQRLNAYLDDAPEANPDFPYFAANALPYWLQRVKILEAENEELRADRNLEKQMRKRQDNYCAELEKQLVTWKKVAQTLHQQLLYESRKFGFTVLANLEDLAKEIKRYLDEVSIEQFEEDLRKAGIERCPNIEEE